MSFVLRMKASWRLSIFLCTMVKFHRPVNFYLSLFTCIDVFLPVQVRALGLIGYVLTSSFLIRENILAVVSLFPLKPIQPFSPKKPSCINKTPIALFFQITINIHASLSYVFTAMGLNIMPSMSLIYMIFGTVVRNLFTSFLSI